MIDIRLEDCVKGMSEIETGTVRLIVADPPYNVSKAGGRKGFKGKKFLDNEWDIIEDYLGFSKQWMDECRRILMDNGTMYVWGYHRSFPYMPISEWYQLNLITWHKRNAFPTTMQNSIWSPSCEYAYFLRKSPGKDHTFHIDKNDFARDFFDEPIVNNAIHPSQKPEIIIHEFVRRSSDYGDLVVDPFSGSGTTAVVCASLERNFVGYETNKSYHDSSMIRLNKTQANMGQANRILSPTLSVSPLFA